MKIVKLVLIALILSSLLVTSVSAKISSEKVVDHSDRTFVAISNISSELRNKVSIAGGDSSYSVTKHEKYIQITKSEFKDIHTKTKCSIDISAIEALPGYNGRDFVVLRLVDGKVVDHRILKTKDVLKGKTVTFDVIFSEVIVSGMTGTYTKTVSVDTLNTTIPFAVTGATAMNVLIDSPGTYIAFDETNISTYPDPSHWLFVWPLNGNALDISGNGRNGAVTGATSTAGRSGTSNTGYYWDGNNDYISYDYPDTLYSANTFFTGYKLNHTVSDSDHVVVDYRNPSGTGRTGMYEYENKYYVNNATSTTTLNSTTNQGWKYAFYPFTNGNINYVWLGNRYNLLYDFKGWMDVAGLYNGTLSADQRRVFSYGYQGITVAPYPTTTRTPILSSNQSVTPPFTMTGVNIKSPTSTTKTVTLIAYLQQNYTLVREWDNTTHKRVDTVFTAGSNITSGVLEYGMVGAYNLSTPFLKTNATGASAEMIGDVLTIHTGALTTGQSRYYNVSMEIIAETPSLHVTNWNASNSSCIGILHITGSSANYGWTVTLNNTTPGDSYSLVNVGTGNTISTVIAGSNATFSISGLVGSVDLRLVHEMVIISDPDLLVTDWDTSNASCIGLLHVSNSSYDNVWTITVSNTMPGHHYYLTNADTEQILDDGVAGSSVTFQINGIVGSATLKITRLVTVTVLSYSPTDTTPTIHNGTIQQFKVSYSVPVDTEWLKNNVTVRTDVDKNATAYWMNASDIGIYNITARISGSQIVWDVNVTSNPNPGSGQFVGVFALATAALVAAGYFWNQFRRRF